ncbi:hypothetical protein DM02DRAFT_627854 [Periconia macrospinosa]|uniref:C2H2-type domain-containing protein n=1 Tax=Periconia macrospinosa TaxID=97972 RepID=A0A2V1DSH5_9PLEO|nr:hypothetical protein DM02DRAFT_627854 [Periconia macrospinosa]
MGLCTHSMKKGSVIGEEVHRPADSELAIDPRLLDDSSGPSVSSEEVHRPADSESAIDPRLLHDSSGPSVSTEEVHRLSDLLFVGSDNKLDDGDDGAFPDLSSELSHSDIAEANDVANIMLNDDSLEKEHDVSTASIETWINSFSKYNVVRNSEAVRIWNKWTKSSKQILILMLPSGPSASEAIHATNPYSSSIHVQHRDANIHIGVSHHVIKAHTTMCAQGRSKVKTDKPHQCPDCSYQGASEKHLNKHVQSTHKFKHRTCPDCPEDSTVYEKKKAYEYYRKKVHTDR